MISWTFLLERLDMDAERITARHTLTSVNATAS